MKKICFVRHGETLWNLEGKTQGSSDIGLSGKGIKQAESVGRYLARKNYKVSKLYSSNLIRAIDTAKGINEFLSIPHIIEEDFTELSFGNWEGLSIKEIGTQYADDLNIWRNEPHNMIFSGGDSLDKLSARTISKINEILETVDDGEVIIIVSHAAAIKTMIISLLELPLDNYYKFSLGNGSISIVEVRPYGNVLSLYNDLNHFDMF